MANEKKYKSGADFEGNQIVDVVLENLAVNPDPLAVPLGRFWYNTVNNLPLYRDDAKIQYFFHFYGKLTDASSVEGTTERLVMWSEAEQVYKQISPNTLLGAVGGSDEKVATASGQTALHLYSAGTGNDGALRPEALKGLGYKSVGTSPDTHVEAFIDFANLQNGSAYNVQTSDTFILNTAGGLYGVPYSRIGVSLSTEADNNLLSLSSGVIGLDNQLQNLVFASPVGSTGYPSFRGLVTTDLPTLATSIGGLGKDVSGEIGNILYADSTSSYTPLANPVSAGMSLVFDGAIPQWSKSDYSATFVEGDWSDQVSYYAYSIDAATHGLGTSDRYLVQVYEHVSSSYYELVECFVKYNAGTVELRSASTFNGLVLISKVTGV